MYTVVCRSLCVCAVQLHQLVLVLTGQQEYSDGPLMTRSDLVLPLALQTYPYIHALDRDRIWTIIAQIERKIVDSHVHDKRHVTQK